MSYGCLVILRKCYSPNKLHTNLVHIAQSKKCGIWFHSTCNLLQENSVKLAPEDYVFELCDSFDNDSASLLLSYDGYSVNGKQADFPLYHRLTIIQDIVTACMPYARSIEIYLGEDSPYLPDYADYVLENDDIAELLYKEYMSNGNSPFIPCVHISIRGAKSNQ